VSITALCANCRDDIGERGGLARDERNAGSLGGEHFGKRPTETTTRSCDQRALS
jgi:hypothetical protein